MCMIVAAKGGAFVRRDAPGAAHEAAHLADGEQLVRGVSLWLGIWRRIWRRLGLVVGLLDRFDLDQVAHAGEGLAPVALGKEAVVTDAGEAVGQDMKEKASDELVRGKPHEAASAAAAIVLEGERHVFVVECDEPRIGNRGAMRVAGEIGQDALRSAEGRLGVDDERAVAERAQALGESGGLGEGSQIAEEAELAATESGYETVEEQAAVGLRQGPDGEQKVGFATDPSPAVEGDAAAGDETMDMRVMGQRLSPGVQDGDETDFGAETLGGERHERLGRGAHQRP